MAVTYEPIASQTLSSAANSVTFSNIPDTFTDLSLVISSASTATPCGQHFRVNGDTGSNYSNTGLYGNGSSALSNRWSNQTFGWAGNTSTDLKTGDPQSAVVQFMNYANTNVNKTVLTSYASASAEVVRIVNLWRSTAAITSITLLTTTANNFASGSTFSLYGIKAA